MTSIKQIGDTQSAIGLAATYIAAHPPFGAYRADSLIGSVSSQIQRRHYGFAVRDGIILGYIGWALCDPETAQAWIQDGQVPQPEQCIRGDVAVILIVVADERPVVRQLCSYVKRLNPGKPFIGRRALREIKPVREGRLGPLRRSVG